MDLVITIKCEVSDAQVSSDIVTLLDRTLPYMADNVMVTSNQEG